jgi:hypothetical protein
MTDNIIQFPKPDEIVFVCGCGCMSFFVNANDTLECCNCHDIKNSSPPDGEWRKWLPDIPDNVTEDTGGKMVVRAIGSAEIARRQTLKHIQDWSTSGNLGMVSAYATDGTGKHWFDIETDEQRQWVLRKLQKTIDHIKAMVIK